jgi:hypothetical protein
LADHKVTRSHAKRKPVRGWRTYRSIAGKVVESVEVSNDDMAAVMIFFRDGTQFHVEVRHSIEFQARTQEMTDDDLVVLHAFPAFSRRKK